MKQSFLALLLLPLFIFGQPLPKPVNSFVSDPSQTLTEEQIKVLNDSILALDKRTSVQIAIVLMNDLETPIEEFARRIGNEWGVGNAKNGVVYVAVINQRLQRMEVAENLEGDLPDFTTLQITDQMKPYFREKDYFGGLRELIEQVKERVDPVAKEQRALYETEQEKRNLKATRFAGNVFLLLLIGGGLYFLFWFFVLLPRAKKREAEEERKRAEANAERERKWAEYYASPAYKLHQREQQLKAAAIAQDRIDNPEKYKKKEDDSGYKSSYTPPSSSSNSDSSSYNFGGSGGFSGGGSTNNW